MGGDFQYQNARINYKNIDKLIEYVNSAAVCRHFYALQLVVDTMPLYSVLPVFVTLITACSEPRKVLFLAPSVHGFFACV